MTWEKKNQIRIAYGGANIVWNPLYRANLFLVFRQIQKGVVETR